MLFDEFGRLINSSRLSMTVMHPLTSTSSSDNMQLLTKYRTAKEAAVIYQTAKTNLIVRAAVDDADNCWRSLGKWQRKPPEMEHFNLSWAD